MSNFFTCMFWSGLIWRPKGNSQWVSGALCAPLFSPLSACKRWLLWPSQTPSSTSFTKETGELCEGSPHSSLAWTVHILYSGAITGLTSGTCSSLADVQCLENCGFTYFIWFFFSVGSNRRLNLVTVTSSWPEAADDIGNTWRACYNDTYLGPHSSHIDL